jgi:succinate dehydrogenase / fumarate reductase flavoprotein subunit
VMGDLVGIIRREGELTDALKRLQELKLRVANVGAIGGRRYNPGWHLALDLRNMLIVSECTAKAALEREESRGGHTREDFPKMNPQWRQINLICSLDGSDVALQRKPVPRMRDELIKLFDRTELSKYMTDDELADYDALAGEAK